MKITTTLMALAIVMPGLVMAQNPTPNPGQPNTQTPPANSDVQQDKEKIKDLRQDVKSDRQDIKNDKEQIKDLDAKHAADVKALNDKEKAAKDALRDDKSLTPAQKKEKIAAIAKDFNAQRKSLNDKFRDDKKALTKDIKKDHREIRKDKREIREAKRDLHKDMHHK